jgi:hypothetical protein
MQELALETIAEVVYQISKVKDQAHEQWTKVTEQQEPSA